jgi:hypothetical protein
MYLATLDCATSNPSLSSTPWMRGAPQSGFSTLIRRINTRSSVSICGRPPRGRDFKGADSRGKPALCQPVDDDEYLHTVIWLEIKRSTWLSRGRRIKRCGNRLTRSLTRYCPQTLVRAHSITITFIESQRFRFFLRA